MKKFTLIVFVSLLLMALAGVAAEGVQAGKVVNASNGGSVLTNVSTAAPTPTPVPPPLVTAINQTLAAKSYRYSSQLIFSDPYRQLELATFAGEVQGKNSHVKISGLLAGPNGVELISYGDKVYYQEGGKWLYKPLKAAVDTARIDPTGTLSKDLKEFSKIGEENVDGQACQIFTIDKEAGRRFLQAQDALPEEAMKTVVNVEATFWVCADGYVRRMLTRSDHLRPDGRTNIYRLERHYFDFGAPIVVSPPADAQPAP
jgi:hypothetical protein